LGQNIERNNVVECRSSQYVVITFLEFWFVFYIIQYIVFGTQFSTIKSR